MWPDLKQLATQVIATAKAAEANGNEEAADEHFDAVGELAEALAEPERLLIVQQYGKSLGSLMQNAAAESE